MYLLDTTHCISLMYGRLGVVQRLKDLDDVEVSTCVIVRGELLFGVHKSGNFADNLARLEFIFEDLKVYTIEEETTDIYAEFKNTILDKFGPKDKRKLRNFNFESLGFKDNDLWIASVAIQHDLILVSSNGHFQDLKSIMGLKVERW